MRRRVASLAASLATRSRLAPTLPPCPSLPGFLLCSAAGPRAAAPPFVTRGLRSHTAPVPPPPPAPPTEAGELPPAWRIVGRVNGPFTVPRTDVFAVVQAGSHQFKVACDDLIYVEKLRGADVHDKVELPRVLMTGTLERTVLGRPWVPNAAVVAVVEEVVRDAKVIIFKKRRRKSSRTLTGHRQQLTALRVVDIVQPELA